MNYKPTIGLEVHVQLKTESKLFCGCSTKFGASPNTHTCEICLGMPGVLPVLNERAVEFALKVAIALNCEINSYSIFARKHYFYPDLPKNYQISQYEQPLAINGYLEIENVKIGIKRVHLEEDAGKLLHFIGSQPVDGTLIDFNRTGIPLLEIVSEPEINSPYQAYLYLITLKQIIEYLDVSDCNMEEGSLRCDANVSVALDTCKNLGVKTELKNMNSFKSVQKALDYEIERQIKILRDGGQIHQETRLWDEKAQRTKLMRTKEEAHDYRYFPEPDLLPVAIKKELIEELRKKIPLLPQVRKEIFLQKYSLSIYDCEVLTQDKNLADFYEEVVSKIKNQSPLGYKTAANLIMVDLLGVINVRGIRIKDSKINPEKIAQLVDLISEGKVSLRIIRNIFEEICDSDKTPLELIEEKGLIQLSDTNLIEKVAQEVIEQNQQVVNDYLAGKEKALGRLVGEVLKKTQGRAHPQLVNKIIKEKLKNEKS